jgi:high-affinity Fe2+/Pb2+ permease
MKKFLLFVEAIILLLGTLLSLTGTSQAVTYSDSYKIYYLVAVLGLLFIGILEFLRKKKYAVYLGIILIFTYLIVAGPIYMNCRMFSNNMSKRTEEHEEARSEVAVDLA